MNKGKYVTHKKYGDAIIDFVFTDVDRKIKAVLLKLETPEGLTQLNVDRDISPFIGEHSTQELIKCYESNLDLIEIENL